MFNSSDDYEIRSKEDLQKKIQEIIDETHPKKGDTIDLNHLDVSRVEDIGYLFYSYLNHIDFTDYNFNVSKWDVSNVTNMESMIDGCKYFNCDLSKWDVSNVINMNNMFFGCKNFNCDLSRWDVSNVEDISGMFDGCDSLEKTSD